MESGAKLIAAKGAHYATREELAQYIPPPATESWKPVSHSELVTTLTDVMKDRGLFIEQEQFAVDKNGSRLFGTFDLTWQKMEEYGAAVGFRHATDKSMAIQIAVGARVFVCSNMSFLGELIAVRKHTSKLELGEEMDRAMYKYMQGFKRLMDDIQIQKDTVIEEHKAKTLIYDIFEQKIVPLRLFPLVTQGWNAVAKDEPKTGWLLHNLFTTHMKTLKPAPAFRSTARLGKFFASAF